MRTTIFEWVHILTESEDICKSSILFRISIKKNKFYSIWNASCRRYNLWPRGGGSELGRFCSMNFLFSLMLIVSMPVLPYFQRGRQQATALKWENGGISRRRTSHSVQRYWRREGRCRCQRQPQRVSSWWRRGSQQRLSNQEKSTPWSLDKWMDRSREKHRSTHLSLLIEGNSNHWAVNHACRATDIW